MEFSEFSVGNITAVEPGILAGEVQFRFSHVIGDKETSDLIVLKIRVGHEGDATLQALEAKLLQEASGLLSQAAQLASQETVESLRRREAEYRRKQQEQSETALAAAFRR